MKLTNHRLEQFVAEANCAGSYAEEVAELAEELLWYRICESNDVLAARSYSAALEQRVSALSAQCERLKVVVSTAATTLENADARMSYSFCFCDEMHEEYGLNLDQFADKLRSTLRGERPLTRAEYVAAWPLTSEAELDAMFEAT